MHWFITQRALFFLALYFSCCQAVLSVALTGCRLCPSDTDTTFRLKETLRIPLKFPYLPALGTYSHPCLRWAALARPWASVAGCCRNSKRLSQTAYIVSAFRRTESGILSNIGKTGFIGKRKMQCKKNRSLTLEAMYVSNTNRNNKYKTTVPPIGTTSVS